MTTNKQMKIWLHRNKNHHIITVIKFYMLLKFSGTIYFCRDMIKTV